MLIKIRITRSAEFCRQTSAQTGDNCPKETLVEVDTKDFSRQGRESLLKIGNGQYHNMPLGMCYDSSYRVHTGQGGDYAYGSIDLVIDIESPTVSNIEAAICLCLAIVAERKQQSEQKEAERQAAADAEKAKKEAKAAKLAEAKEILSIELDRLAKYAKDRVTLGDFLARIPEDVLRATALEVASGTVGIDDVIFSIEDATPICIFADSE